MRISLQRVWGLGLGISVQEIIRQVLPNGTAFDSEQTAWGEPPVYPPDAFAVAGVLLQRAGAYQYVVSAEKRPASDFPPGSICCTASMRDRIRKCGESWASGSVPVYVEKLWKTLIECDKPIYVSPNGKALSWWKSAFELLAIADEASRGAGYFITAREADSQPWVALAANAMLEAGVPPLPSNRHVRHHDESICTIASLLVDPDVVCVQPKSRTPDVGCSLRNISHNLSLLPPRGHMKVHWLAPPVDQGKEVKANLNLLLIPYPYKIENEWFSAEPICDEASDGWGWFAIRQEWLSRHSGRFIEFVDALIEQAKTEKGQISGLVFPEYSLDYGLYEKLAEHLRDNHPSFDFLVAGTSRNCNGDDGNFALASHFYEVEGGKRAMATVSRPKHHRWSIEASQIKGYKLNACFPTVKSKDFRWWEKIPLHQRRIHVNSLRASSVFTAMICEDLARSDPVHEPLRSIGANLVFVLLMDGPQIEWRWSGRYSTGLAEDPGSSVLTLTSKALVERWNDKKPKKEQNWNIGIWKDTKHRAIDLNCSEGAQALVIEITGRSQIERTVDGRVGREAFSWEMVKNPVEVSLDEEQKDLRDYFCG